MDGCDERGVSSFYDRIAVTYAERIARLMGYREQVERFLAEHASPGRRVLDVGCGPGNLTAGLPAEVEVAGLDLSPEMIALAREARPGGTWVVGSFHRPFPEEIVPPFDAVLMVGAFEFCADLDGVVARLAAAARPDGALLLGVTERRGALDQPTRALPAMGVSGDTIVIRIFTLEQMLAAFRGAGLLPVRYEHAVGWTDPAGTQVPHAIWELRKG